MVSVAISLASSPAAAPPIPSATTNSVPRSPTSCSRTAGWSDAARRVRSATRKRSSLWSRVRPRSVLAKTSILMGLGARPNMLGPVLAVHGGAQVLETRVPGIDAHRGLDPVVRLPQILDLEEVDLGERVRRVRPYRLIRGGGEDVARRIDEQAAREGVDRVLQDAER